MPFLPASCFNALRPSATVSLSIYELCRSVVISRKPWESERTAWKNGTSGKMEKVRSCWQIEKSNGNRKIYISEKICIYQNDYSGCMWVSFDGWVIFSFLVCLSFLHFLQWSCITIKSIFKLFFFVSLYWFPTLIWPSEALWLCLAAWPWTYFTLLGFSFLTCKWKVDSEVSSRAHMLSHLWISVSS